MLNPDSNFNLSLSKRGILFLFSLVGLEILAFFTNSYSINSIAVPLFVAFIVSLIQINAVKKPKLNLNLPKTGFEGESISLNLNFKSKRSIQTDISIETGENINIETRRDELKKIIDKNTKTEYEISLLKRGKHPIGKIKLTLKDQFGFYRKKYEYSLERKIIVFPKVYRLSHINKLTSKIKSKNIKREKRTKGRIREYNPGDRMKDIHWRLSAKDPDNLIVKEKIKNENNKNEEIKIGIISSSDNIENTARVCASLVFSLLKEGYKVGVFTQKKKINPDIGRDHLYEILKFLSDFSSSNYLKNLDCDIILSSKNEKRNVKIRLNEGREYKSSNIVDKKEYINEVKRYGI